MSEDQQVIRGLSHLFLYLKSHFARVKLLPAALRKNTADAGFQQKSHSNYWTWRILQHLIRNKAQHLLTTESRFLAEVLDPGVCRWLPFLHLHQNNEPKLASGGRFVSDSASLGMYYFVKSSTLIFLWGKHKASQSFVLAVALLCCMNLVMAVKCETGQLTVWVSLMCSRQQLC